MHVPAGAARVLAATALIVALAPLAAAQRPGGAGAAPVVPAEVRRHEYVLLVRTRADTPNAIGHAEAAAFQAGAAVLEVARDEPGPRHDDHRMLVRTRGPEVIGGVLREIRRVGGVLGATATQLPETPTTFGGPSFLTAYLTELGPMTTRSGVVVRHDVPPVLDRRDLLEMAPVPVGPSLGGPETAGTGGFSLNVSEMFKRMQRAAWLRREQRLRDRELLILPDDAESGESGVGR